MAADFSGPYPDGHYNLVINDWRPRYQIVESIAITAFKFTRQKFKNIFATYGTPIDNGPPFNSREFKQFAGKDRFPHHCITPLQPRANWEPEAFMHLVKKQIRYQEDNDNDSTTEEATENATAPEMAVEKNNIISTRPKTQTRMPEKYKNYVMYYNESNLSMDMLQSYFYEHYLLA